MGVDVTACAGYGIEVTDKLLMKIFKDDIDEYLEDCVMDRHEAWCEIESKVDTYDGIEDRIYELKTLEVVEVGNEYSGKINRYILIKDILNNLDSGLAELSEIFGKVTKEELVWICDVLWH